MYYLVAPTIIAHGDHPFLTYEHPDKLPTGTIVTIEVGKKSVIGVVYDHTTKPSFKTKPISAIVETQPLPRHLLELAQWMSSYYATHLAVVLQTMLPRGLSVKRRNANFVQSHPSRKRTKFVLNSDQQAAIDLVTSADDGTILLRGVTGSGKTRVYIELAKSTIESGKSVILLVPEIALTSQLVAEFTQHFDHVIVTHSTMTEAQRHIMWQQALTSAEPMIIIGPRSALFSPLARLGLIVVDESHEPSYKQDQSPRYSALRVASMIARFAHIKTVFGSATPPIVDTYLATQSKRPIALMPMPAAADVQKSQVSVVDLKQREHFSRHRFLSTQLLDAISSALADKKQSLVFHNRRGSAPLTLCEQCGWTAACPTCYMPLTLHTDVHKLQCHVCGHKESVPPNCPVCRQPDILHRGIGTKFITEELQKQFKNASIARFDTDVENDKQLHTLYQQLYDGGIDIIVGTQMIAKGLDLPHLRTVGIIQADGGLSMPDYQSAERVFQLIYQVSGRVGRSHHASHVIVQTYQPNHPAVALGIEQDYDTFYESEIAERRRALFPPFCHLLKLTCSYATERGAINASQKLALSLKQSLGTSVQILGPAPSFYERLGGSYRWQLVLKSSSRESLIRAAALTPKQNWFVDLDPSNLL